MDYDAVEQAINERTKAIIPVDLGGIVCDYDRLFQVIEAKRAMFRPTNPIQEQLGRVAVVSDCAHALGASRHGKMAGQVADCTSFSFHAVKNFTTAGGAERDLEYSVQMMRLFTSNISCTVSMDRIRMPLAKTKLGAWEYDIIGALV